VIKKILLLLLVVSFSIPVFAAGSKEEPSKKEPQAAVSETENNASSLEGTVNDPRLYTPGKLTVATGDPVYPPWMMDNDPSNGEGFESALVYALAAEMGFAKEDVVWVRQTFDQGIAPGEKHYDFNIQQYSITEERKKFVDFSHVYYQPEKVLVALSSDALAGAKTFEDLRKLEWGATIGTSDLDYIEQVIGVKDVAVYNEMVATFQALQANQIDATVISLPTALYVTAVQVPEAKIAAVLPSDPNDAGFGMVFEKDNPLVDWVNEALDKIIADGVVTRLTEEYLITDKNIPEITE